MPQPDLEILLPVHNEAGSIEATLREIHSHMPETIAYRFLIREDGSSDGTKQVLAALERELPMLLKMSDGRRGYSAAVCDGMRSMEAGFLLCLDSDGQCDPADIAAFWEARQDADILLGWRVRRADSFMRRLMSGIFYLAYQAAFRVPVHDPSCPFMLTRREVATRLAPELGAMQQGFWWEFVARAHRRGYRIMELPIHHRPRSAGATQVYRWQRLAGIFFRHLAAIPRIWRETR